MKAAIAVPVTALLVIRSYRRQSLTIPGIIAAAITATLHALPDSPLPFTLLCTFFLLGTSATKVKHHEKAKLTLSSSGASGGEGPRTHIQVLANSACASFLCLLEYLSRPPPTSSPLTTNCFALSPSPSSSTTASRYLTWCLLGSIANYAATAADTLSSELGILSSSTPFLITAPWRRVPRGTNGGVTLAGILYGSLGAAAIAVTSIMLLPFCLGNADHGGWAVREKALLAAAVTVWGTLGSLLDSLLGALLQASIVDRRTGKVVEGAGGVRVKTHRRTSSASSAGSASGVDGGQQTTRLRKTRGGKEDAANGARGGVGQESRFVGSGRDILDNNGINFLMAAVMTVGGIVMGDQLRGLLA